MCGTARIIWNHVEPYVTVYQTASSINYFYIAAYPYSLAFEPYNKSIYYIREKSP